ncbi:sulfite exporter TauE/SafE family protein [bacterium]|nr:sulfite exporter TauE/SafE family protein [bacterium]
MFVIWSGALIIGITLGMLGSGGSAITVPVLVYLVGHGAKESIAESMAIVGLISIAAAIPYARARQIDWRSVWLFGIPGMAGTFLGAWLGGIAPDSLQLSVFGVVLFLAAFSMFDWKRNRQAAGVSEETEDSPATDEPIHRSPMWKVATEGSVVGVLTGFVGVGGGFLIVPALVLLGKLSMRLAVGTSLLIIAAKSLVGFAKYEHHLLQMGSSADMQVVLLFFVIGAAGALLGRKINARLDQRVLKNVFAVFLILLGGFVVVREGSRLWEQPVESGQAKVTALTGVDSSYSVPTYTKL